MIKDLHQWNFPLLYKYNFPFKKHHIILLYLDAVIFLKYQFLLLLQIPYQIYPYFFGPVFFVSLFIPALTKPNLPLPIFGFTSYLLNKFYFVLLDLIY